MPGSFDSIKQSLSDPGLLKLIMAAGGASALAGGYLSSKGQKRMPGGAQEDPKARRNRILRNALLSGAAGAGAAGLLGTGMKTMERPIPGNEKADAVSGLLANNQPLLAGGAVAGGYVGGHGWLQKLISDNGKTTGQVNREGMDTFHKSVVGERGSTNALLNKFGLSPERQAEFWRQAEKPEGFERLLKGNRQLRAGLMQNYESRGGAHTLQEAGLRPGGVFSNAGAGSLMNKTVGSGTGSKLLDMLSKKAPGLANAGSEATWGMRKMLGKSMTSPGRMLSGTIAAPLMALLLQQKFLNPTVPRPDAE